MEDKQKHFKGTVVRCVYSSPDFKTYAMDVRKEDYPDIKHNKFNNVSVIGDISDLIEGIEYDIIATEENTKYGVSYRVVNIRRDIPMGIENTRAFLNEIINRNQSDVLLSVYPNIVDIVMSGNTDVVDLSKLHGIKEKTFDRIKTKIIENFKLADLVGEFKGALSISMLKKIYDKYSDIDVLRARLREEPYTTLTNISRVGFKTADAIIIKLQKENIVDFGYDVKTSKDRCYACIIYILQENEDEGHTKMNLSDLRGQCIKMIPSCVDYFAEVIKSDDIYYDKNNMSVGLMRSYEAEKYIAETIGANIKTTDVWNLDVEKYRNVGKFELSDEQMSAPKNLCKYGISILNGAAGTGKTQSTLAIINMLKENHKDFLLLSPTGKAAKVLSGYTGEKACTIHRGLCYNPKKGWYFNKDQKLQCDVVIVDEVSMCSAQLFKHLIDAIDFRYTRLLLVGDNAQLPSVGCGNLFHDFMESGVIPTSTLTKVFRYADGGLSKIATDTRYCKPYLNKAMKGKRTQFGANKDYVFVDIDSNQIPIVAVKLYKKLIDSGNKPEDVQVLSAKNVGDCGTIILNSMVQKVVNNNYGKDRFMKYGDVLFYDDDLVIQTKNNYQAPMCDDKYEVIVLDNGILTAMVANGETGVIKYACNDYAVIDFDGILVRYDKAMMISVKLGYAITVHKSQGSGIKNVILCTPKSHMFMLNSNILYTGITRTTDKCYHLGSVSVVNTAVKKKANLTRHTFLKDLLCSVCDKSS